MEGVFTSTYYMGRKERQQYGGIGPPPSYQLLYLAYNSPTKELDASSSSSGPVTGYGGGGTQSGEARER